MEHRRRIATYAMALGLLVAVGILAVGGVEIWLAGKRLADLQKGCTSRAAIKRRLCRRRFTGFATPGFMRSLWRRNA